MRARSLAIAAGLLLVGTALPLAAAAQAPSNLCELMAVRTGDQPGGGPNACSVSLEGRAPERSGSITPTWRGTITLDRRGAGEACALFDRWKQRTDEDARKAQDEAQVTFVIAPLEGIGERGFEVIRPHYVLHPRPNSDHIHPANYNLHFCWPPYGFYAALDYFAGPGEPVPDALIEDLRGRARETLEKLGGPRAEALSSSDAERELIEALGPGAISALTELADLGLLEINDVDLEITDVDLLRRSLAREPKIQQTVKDYLTRLGASAGSGLTGARLQAMRTVHTAAQLAEVLDVNGSPAFPASGANLQVLMDLGVRGATDPDPVVAHQALTAMERYAAMLQDLDVKALRERHGVPAAPPSTGSEKS